MSAPPFKKNCPCIILPPPFLIFQIPPKFTPPLFKGLKRGVPNYACPKPFSPKLRYWKLKEQTVQKELERVFTWKMNAFNTAAASPQEIRNLLKTALLNTTNETCGKTKKRHRKRVTWWWNDEVNLAIVEKRRCWEAWKKGGNKKKIPTGQTKHETYSLNSKEDCWRDEVFRPKTW